MAFELFDKKAATASKQPFVTIQKKGPFSLNKAAYEALGEPSHVEMLYDLDNKLVAFRQTPGTKPHAYPLRAQGPNNATFMVAGAAFTKHYGIDTSVARRYTAELRDDMLVIDLGSESTDVTGPRGRRSDRT